MTTYYVKPTGDNTKDGLSSANAWRMINYALTQMIANDELNIMAGAYAEYVAITTEHITLTGAGSGSVTINNLQLIASHTTVTGLTATTSTCITDTPTTTNTTLEDVIGEDMVLLTGANSAIISNCDFTGLFLSVNANAAAFTNCICRPSSGGQHTIHITGAGVTNATFTNTTIVGDPGAYKAIRISNGTNTTFTNTTFEYPEKAIEVTSGATATFIQGNRKVFVGTAGATTVTPTNSTLIVADGTYDYRDFIVTPDASIVIAETSLWETSGDQNKAWKVEATGSRTITFRLTDMLPDTKYDLLANSTKVATAESDGSGVLSFDYTGSFSEKTFETALYTPPPPPLQDINDYKTIRWTVSKGIADYFWVLKAKIDKHVTPNFFEKTIATAVDHQGIRRTPFVGIIPAIDYTLKTAADKANTVGYDYAWYLTVQHVPDGMETIDIDQNPSQTVADLLGGADWEKETGIEPWRMNNVDAWSEESDPPKKSFTFKESTTKWSAIVEIADYCNFVFVVKWRELSDGTMRPCAYFVHENDVDTGGTGLDLPGEMTVDAPDSYLINDVTIKDEPLYKFNRVICNGYSQATNEFFSSVAQTAGVGAGTEIPREYTYTDASLNTKAKTDTKAQQLLEDFQASSIIYRAKFKNRMDLELYQTVSFGGYPKIDSNEMRITKITYRRRPADDTVEIEFCKNQAVQQLKRLQRVMKTRIHYETFIDDMWEKSGAYAQLIEDAPINFRGWGAYNITTIYGPQNADMGFHGWDSANERGQEFARWKHNATGQEIDSYLEIKQNLFINNDPYNSPPNRFPKIYFDITKDTPTYIRGNRYTEFNGLDIIVGGHNMMSFVSLIDSENPDYIVCKRNLNLLNNITVGGRIEAPDYEELTFRDDTAGEKTLEELASAGLWLEASGELGDFIQVKTPKAIHMGERHIRYLAHPVYDRDAATKYWCEQTFGTGGGAHTHSAADITSGTLAMRRGGTGNDHGDAESVGGFSLVQLEGYPETYSAGASRDYTWYIQNVKVILATPDLSYESEPATGSIVAYVLKQEESDNEVTIRVYNGSGTSQYIGVRAIAFCY